MNKLVIFGVLFLLQVYCLRDYIMPLSKDTVQVQGQYCTCPEEKVLNGFDYLKRITPDSLKEYALDYSEVFVNEMPATDVDPTGVETYVVEVEVVGKRKVSNNSSVWNPLLKVNSWKVYDKKINWLFRGFLLLEILTFMFFIRFK